MNLELMALRWVLYEKKCEMALRERSPRVYPCGEPDVLGITKNRYLIEIEIKRSLSDFKADAHKFSRKNRGGDFLTNATNREWLFSKLPKQFYYLVPCELTKKVEPLVPEWAGLMRGPGRSEPQGIVVVKTAPANNESKRLSVKECCRLVRMVANWAMSESESKQASLLRFREGAWQWPEPDFEI